MINVVVPTAIRRQKSCFSPKSSQFALQTGIKWLCRVLQKSEQNCSGFANPKSAVLVRNIIPDAASPRHARGASLVSGNVGLGGLCSESLAFEVSWDCQVKLTASDFIWRTSAFTCLWKSELTNRSFNKWPTEVYFGFHFLIDFRCSFRCSALSSSRRDKILCSFQDWPCGFCKLKELKHLPFFVCGRQICGPWELSKEMPTRPW